MQYIRESNGTYTFPQAVTPALILAIAAELIDQRHPKGTNFNAPETAIDFLRHKIGHLPDEHFYVLYLNTQHELIAAVDTFRGSLSSTQIHPRVIVREALLNNSAAVIFGHNHPSGLAEPSQADRAVTVRLREALALIDVRVLDHIVIGGRDAVSFAQRGIL